MPFNVEPTKFYKKVGNKYVEVGIEFSGFPANGIWYVKDGSQSLMTYVKDISEFPSDMEIDYMSQQKGLLDVIMDAINESPEKKGLSLNDLATLSCKYFADLKAKKIQREIFEF